MSLPSLPYTQGIMHLVVRTVFGGLNHNPGARDGEIYDMKNISYRSYPLLSSRSSRTLLKTLNNPGGLGAGSLPYWTEDVVIDNVTYTCFRVGSEFGNGVTWDGGVIPTGGTRPRGEVTPGQKVFARMGTRILIFPDKKYFDTGSETFGSMEASRSGSVGFRNGTYTGVPAQANTIYLSGADWGTDFHPGDAVTIAGCVTHPENNGSFIIREIDGDYLRFYDNSFTLDRVWDYTVGADGLEAGTYHFTPEETALQFDVLAMSEGDTLHWDGAAMTATVGGVTSSVSVTSGSGGDELIFSASWVNYTESGTVSISRDVPDLTGVCVNENRLWGFLGGTIYASKLGDPFNFNAFDGLSTDSWQSGTLDAGNFTACYSYMGYPIFFKENAIYKIHGDRADNFQATSYALLGVQPGGERSLAVAGETLYYLSRAGICAYNGGVPTVISEPLGKGTRWIRAVGGSDGLRYYVSLTRYGGAADATNLYVYDTQMRLWYKEDGSDAVGLTYWNGGLSLLRKTPGSATGEAQLWRLDGQFGLSEGQYDWAVEFAPSTMAFETTDTGSQNKKGLLRILMQVYMGPSSSMTVKIKYDTAYSWDTVREYSTYVETRQSVAIPLVLRRSDYYQIRLEGTGQVIIYSITEEKYSGSWKQPRKR